MILFAWCQNCGNQSDMEFDNRTHVGRCPSCSSFDVKPHVSPKDKVPYNASRDVVFRAAIKYRETGR